MSKIIIVSVCVVILGLPLMPTTAAQGPDAGDLPSALHAFIRAFDDLDWETFRTFFADDATVFYPRTAAKRAQGRAAFEAEFKGIFETIRAGRSSPPYMDIQPLDLQIQTAGEVAIVTFHLDDRPGFLNRRTMVWRKSSSGWKIIHLHASEVAVGPPGKP